MLEIQKYRSEKRHGKPNSFKHAMSLVQLFFSKKVYSPFNAFDSRS